MSFEKCTECDWSGSIEECTTSETFRCSETNVAYHCPQCGNIHLETWDWDMEYDGAPEISIADDDFEIIIDHAIEAIYLHKAIAYIDKYWAAPFKLLLEDHPMLREHIIRLIATNMQLRRRAENQNKQKEGE